MTSETNDTTMELGMQAAACYLAEAVQHLHDGHRLRPMRVETTISDDDGSRVIARIDVTPQDGFGGVTIEQRLGSLSDGELLLASGAALALYSDIGAWRNRVEVGRDEAGEE